MAQGTWTQYAGGPERTSTIRLCEFDPSWLASPAWTTSRDSSGRTISFVGHQQPLVSLRDVLAVGSVVNGSSRRWCLYAFSRRTGQLHWEAPIPTPALDSWSTPAIDVEAQRVYVASGSSITCLHLHSGVQLWQTQLLQNVVNASPCLVSSGLYTGTLYITDFDGAGGGGHLYSINTAEPIHRPGRPPVGSINWVAFLNGTSGNSPAYANGCVYVSTAGDYSFAEPGSVRAFNLEGKSLWETPNLIGEGYYGGVGIARDADKTYVLASSYAFFGNSLSANTELLDANCGARLWSAPTNRSSAIPVPLDSNHFAVSGGVQGFGTSPTLQIVTASDGSASNSWSSLGLSRMGGWAAQPLYDLTNDLLYVGEVSSSSTIGTPGIRLHVIDVKRLIGLNTLQQTVYSGFGSSPVIAGTNLYTIGAAGLYAFGPVPINGDVNDDGWVDVEDLYQFGQGPSSDVDGDGVITPLDRDRLEQLIIGNQMELWEQQRRVKG